MLNAFNQTHARNFADAIHASGQTITVLETPPRTIRARVNMLTAEELANCAEQYNCRLHVAAVNFPAAPPEKGMLVIVNGVRRGVIAVREKRPNDVLMGWMLECKG